MPSQTIGEMSPKKLIVVIAVIAGAMATTVFGLGWGIGWLIHHS